MENVFNELSESELCDTKGGFILTTTLFTIGGIEVTGAMCAGAGITFGVAAGTTVRLKNN